MLKIRLKRNGRKKTPHYRVVVMSSKNKRDGKAIEEVGYYNPISKDIFFNQSRIIERINQGTRPTSTVKRLLRKAHIL